MPKTETPSQKLSRERATARREYLERTFALQLQAARIPFAQQVRFHPWRLWRFDFVIGDRFAVEVHGGTYSGGRHVRGAGMDQDAEKMAEALVMGWRVLVVTATHVRSGQALQWVRRIMEGV